MILLDDAAPSALIKIHHRLQSLRRLWTSYDSADHNNDQTFPYTAWIIWSSVSLVNQCRTWTFTYRIEYWCTRHHIAHIGKLPVLKVPNWLLQPQWRPEEHTSLTEDCFLIPKHYELPTLSCKSGINTNLSYRWWTAMSLNYRHDHSDCNAPSYSERSAMTWNYLYIALQVMTEAPSVRVFDSFLSIDGTKYTLLCCQTFKSPCIRHNVQVRLWCPHANESDCKLPAAPNGFTLFVDSVHQLFVCPHSCPDAMIHRHIWRRYTPASLLNNEARQEGY